MNTNATRPSLAKCLFLSINPGIKMLNFLMPLFMLVLVLGFLSDAHAEASYTAKVMHVGDGDSITIQRGNADKVRVRLVDIDAPEYRQTFGNIAGSKLRTRLEHQDVRLQVVGTDHYNRLLAVVFLKNENINEWMVHEGLAWAWIHTKNARIISAQEEAQREKRGLWKAPNPTPPWTFRKQQKAKKNARKYAS